MNPGLEVFTKCRIAHSSSRSGWNPVSVMGILTIDSSMAAGLPADGLACVVVSRVLDVAIGGGVESFWRLRGESIGSSWDLMLAMLGRRDPTRDPQNYRIQYVRKGGPKGASEGRLKGHSKHAVSISNKIRKQRCNNCFSVGLLRLCRSLLHH